MRWLKFIALFLFLIILFCVAAFVYLSSPVNANSDEKIEFTVKAGESTRDVATTLENQKIIKNAFAFYIYLKVTKGIILPGLYEVSPSMSSSDIAQEIASGKFKTVKITIPEGWRVTQMEDYFTEKNLDKVTDFKAKAEQYEGYLFPDTYVVKKDITTEDLITEMRDNYKKKTADLKITPETIILASIVEREAKTDEERYQIAAVYSNRLKIGMKMEADPTVQYAKGDWKAPTVEDYHSVISPYNTYLNEGLPPGPICNPGLASIKAAANPGQNDYIFFFHAKGEIFYSKTLEEHRAKVKQEF